MSSKTERLIKALKSESRSELEILVQNIHPDPKELTSDQMHSVAEYISTKPTSQLIGLETVERWYHASYEAGHQLVSLYKTAVTRARMKDWDGAVQMFRLADPNLIARESYAADWFGQYGWCAHRAGHSEESYIAFRQLLENHPDDHPNYLHQILRGTTDKFLQKVRAAQFLERNSQAIEDELQTLSEQSQDDSSDLVFTYWAQGYDKAPPLVQASITAWRREVGDRLVVLDEQLLPYWISFDQKLHDRLPAVSARFSDLLRVELLSKYGGTWVDATTFPTEIYSTFFSKISDCKVFAPRYQGAAISSWYINASNRSRLVRRLTAALRVYWRQNKKAVGYFMFHFFFECIANGFGDASKEWGESPVLSSQKCHKLHAILGKEVDGSEFDRRRLSAPIQKMTYKYDHIGISPESGVSRLLRWSISTTTARVSK